MNIVIVGAGNMGSIFASKLMRAGYDVTMVARNERLRELQQNGLRLRHQYKQKTERFTPDVCARLTPDIEADLILVMVQRPHIDALMPDLAQHPCRRICFMFNCSEINPEWQKTLGKRLVWGFPSALGSTKDGIVRYLVLPGWLRFLQITTIGIAEGGDPEVARMIVNVLNKAKIASTFHPDMRSWLMTHTGLMLAGMMIGEKKIKTEKKQMLTCTEACQMMRAQKECFTVIRSIGAQITPLNLRLLSIVPGILISPTVWLLSRSNAYARAVVGHVDHAHDEIQSMYGGIKVSADRSRISTPVLDILNAELS